jgi:hypothetical protein
MIQTAKHAAFVGLMGIVGTSATVFLAYTFGAWLIDVARRYV